MWTFIKRSNWQHAKNNILSLCQLTTDDTWILFVIALYVLSLWLCIFTMDQRGFFSVFELFRRILNFILQHIPILFSWNFLTDFWMDSPLWSQWAETKLAFPLSSANFRMFTHFRVHFYMIWFDWFDMKTTWRSENWKHKFLGKLNGVHIKKRRGLKWAGGIWIFTRIFPFIHRTKVEHDDSIGTHYKHTYMDSIKRLKSKFEITHRVELFPPETRQTLWSGKNCIVNKRRVCCAIIFCSFSQFTISNRRKQLPILERWRSNFDLDKVQQ